MSVFQVTLNNTVQGALDVYPMATNTIGQNPYSMQEPDTYTSTGAGSSTTENVLTTKASLQRTVYIMGPNRVNRERHDGETFTDCNYFKRYCAYDPLANPTGVTDPANVILTCVYDDGSVWIDENPNRGPCRAVAVPQSVTFTGTSATGANFLSTYGGFANFLQITNLDTASGASHSLQVTLNGSTSSVFTVLSGDTVIFDKDDILISQVQVGPTASGQSIDAQVVFGIAARAST